MLLIISVLVYSTSWSTPTSDTFKLLWFEDNNIFEGFMFPWTMAGCWEWQ